MAAVQENGFYRRKKGGRRLLRGAGGTEQRVVLSVRVVAKGDREVEEFALIFETESKGVFNGLNFKISEKKARRFLDF